MKDAIRGWWFEGDDPMPWREVAITTLAVAVPPVLAILAFGRMGAVAFIASLAAHLSAKDEGVLTGTVVSLVLVISGLLSLGDPDLALLTAASLGIMTGICGLRGMARPPLRARITWTVFTSPILPATEKPLLFALFILAMVWSLGVTHVFGQSRTTGDEDQESAEYALVFGIAFAVGLTLSVYIGGRFFGDHGFWFPLTFVVLCLPPHGRLFRRTLKRTVGTVLGTAAAVAVALVSEATWLVVTLGAVSLPLAFRMLPYSYTIFTAMLTICVLELLALVSPVSTLAAERLYTMAAAAAMTYALGIVGYGVLMILKPDAAKTLREG